MFFILTVTHIHPCKDEARANKLKRFKESLCERILPQSCYITPKKKSVKWDLKSTSANLYQMSDLRNW